MLKWEGNYNILVGNLSRKVSSGIIAEKSKMLGL